MSRSRRGRTLLDKLWDAHVVRRGEDGGPDLLYVDLHLLHEMTSPQAFEGLRAAGRGVRRADLTVATEDHNVPTDGPGAPVLDPLSRLQLDLLRDNCAEFGVPLHRMGSAGNGIVHVIGPEQGRSQPGMTIVCGDSHTSTHGAFGALGLGIGSSEVEHVLATQTLWLARPEAMEVLIEGELGPGVSAKDLALHVVHTLGSAGGQGAVLEFRGDTVRRLSMEGRMTLCNMSIEAGARGGMVAPDDTTLGYLEGRAFAPTGAALAAARQHWSTLVSDRDAVFGRRARIDATLVRPTVTWGTMPAHIAPLGGVVPDPAAYPDGPQRELAVRALAYMDLTPGTAIGDIAIDRVFIGSCTNGRLEDLRAAAEVLTGRRVAEGVRAMVVPGSMAVARRAEEEGLDRIFTGAGFEWRGPGCSMCTAMNPDRLGPGQRSASTTNRNFEGRQGPSSRTHLVSPAVAAATAVAGRLRAPADL